MTESLDVLGFPGGRLEWGWTCYVPWGWELGVCDDEIDPWIYIYIYMHKENRWTKENEECSFS